MDTRRDTHLSRGFTLTELLVVITVLGVLAAVVVGSISGIGDRGQSAACGEDTRTLKVAEETYKAAHNTYATETQLVSGGSISAQSTLHDIVINGATYSIVDVGACVGTSTSTTQPANLPPGVTVGTGGSSGVTVELLNSSGQPLSGGLAEYSSQAWNTIGTTGSDGRATSNLAAGSYSFRIDFRGQTTDSGTVAVTSGSIVTFHTAPVTLHLVGNGAPLDPAAVAYRGNDGYWMTADDTDASGNSTAQLLQGSYTPRVDFSGQTNVLSAFTLTTTQTINVQLVTTTLTFVAGPHVLHRGNNGVWSDDGIIGYDHLVLALLPGTYSFVPNVDSALTSGTKQQVGQFMTIVITGISQTVHLS